MFKKIMAMSLAAAMSVLCCACQSQSESTDTSNDVSTFDASGNTSIDTNFIHDENLKLNSYKAEKLGEFKLPSDLEETDCDEAGGLVYSKNGKYGIMSNDGKHDTGLVYDYCKPTAGSLYFVVAKTYKLDSKNVDSLNVLGLVDGDGNTILDEKYAAIDVHDEAFVVASVVKSIADDKWIAWYSKDDNAMSNTDIGDVGYTGTASVYSLRAHKFLDALSVTTSVETEKLQFNQAYVRNDNGLYNYKGEKISEHSDYSYGYIAGSYCQVERKAGENGSADILDKDGNVVFTIDNKGVTNTGKYDMFHVEHCMTQTSGGSFASDSCKEYISLYNNETDKYDLIDLQTKEVVLQMDYYADSIYGSVVIDDEDIAYNLHTGEKLDFLSDSIGCDGTSAVLGNGCQLSDYDKDEILYLDNDCNVIAKLSSKDDTFGMRSFGIDTYSEANHESVVYSYGDKKFIAGSSVGDFLIENEGNLIDITSGKTVISGYSSYRVADGGDYLIITCIGDNDNYARYKLTKDA